MKNRFWWRAAMPWNVVSVHRKALAGLTGTSWTWDTKTAEMGYSAFTSAWCSDKVDNTAAASFSATVGSAVKAGDLLLAHITIRSDDAASDGWDEVCATEIAGSNQRTIV